jgi:hypothetical protein
MASTANRIKQLFLLTLLPMSLLLASHRRNEVDPITGIDSYGNAVAVWEDVNTNIHIIYSATKTLSGAWTPEVQLSVTGLHSYSPHFLMNENGDCTATWFADDPSLGTTTLYAAIMPSGGSWGNIAQLSAASEHVDNGSASISMDSQGKIRVMWKSLNLTAGTSSVQDSEASITSGWTAPVTLN